MPFKLLDGKTTIGAGDSLRSSARQRVLQAVLTGTGAVAANVTVQVSLDDQYWEDLVTFDLSGTNSDSDGVASEAPWLYVRAYVNSISGTGAAVTLRMEGTP